MNGDAFIAATLFVAILTMLGALGFYVAIVWCLGGFDATEEVGR